MPDFLEAVVTMLPVEVGGRATLVMPRDGSYRPFLRDDECGVMLRVRFIEGPPVLGPGDCGRVVLEIENGLSPVVVLRTGTEMALCESSQRLVGIVTVARLWRDAALV